MAIARSASVYADFLLPHLTDQARLVDVGCGDGELTVDLAEHVHSVVGVDTDVDEIAAARALAARCGLSNATFQIGDAYELGLADESADAVLGHSSLEALDRPRKALAEMWRVLRPGGVVAVASVEYDGLILSGPRSDLLRRFYDIREQLWLRDGADPYLGRRLRGLLAESGFADIEATTKALSYGTPELVSTFGRGRAEECGDAWYAAFALETGLATQADLSAMRAAWLEFADSPSAYASFTWCRALGWKR
jgi:SAM-dependent methyltransferase